MSEDTTLLDPDATREMSHAELSRVASSSSAHETSALVAQLERLDRLIETPALLILEPQRGGGLIDARLGDEIGGPLPALLTPSSEAPQGVFSHTYEALYGADEPSESTLTDSLIELQQLSEGGDLRGKVNPIKVHLASLSHLRARCLAHVQHEVHATLLDITAIEESHTSGHHTLKELRSRAERRLERLVRIQSRVDERALLISAQLFDSFKLQPMTAPQVTVERPNKPPKVKSPSLKRAPWKTLKQGRSRLLAVILTLLLHPGLWLSEPSFSALLGLGGLWPIVCLACALYPITTIPATLVSVGLSALEPTGVVSQTLERSLGHAWQALPEVVTRWLPIASFVLIADLIARRMSNAKPLKLRVACLFPSSLGSAVLVVALIDQLQSEPLTIHSAPVLFSPYIIALVAPANALSGALKARLTPLILTLTCAVFVSSDLYIELGLLSVSRGLELIDSSLLTLLQAPW